MSECFYCGEPVGHADGCPKAKKTNPKAAAEAETRLAEIKRIDAERKTCPDCGIVIGPGRRHLPGCPKAGGGTPDRTPLVRVPDPRPKPPDARPTPVPDYLKLPETKPIPAPPVEVKPKPPEASAPALDPEFTAMLAVERAITGLTPAAALRVLAWAGDRQGVLSGKS